MFPKAPVQTTKATVKIGFQAPIQTTPVRTEKVMVKNVGGGSNRVINWKILVAEKRELTESNFVDKLSSVNIPKSGYDKYPG